MQSKVSSKNQDTITVLSSTVTCLQLPNHKWVAENITLDVTYTPACEQIKTGTIWHCTCQIREIATFLPRHVLGPAVYVDNNITPGLSDKLENYNISQAIMLHFVLLRQKFFFLKGFG